MILYFLHYRGMLKTKRKKPQGFFLFSHGAGIYYSRINYIKSFIFLSSYTVSQSAEKASIAMSDIG